MKKVQAYNYTYNHIWLASPIDLLNDTGQDNPGIAFPSASQPALSDSSEEGPAPQAAVVPQPNAPGSSDAPQLLNYTYTEQSAAGSNVVAAWGYSTGQNTTVAVIDDGFDPTITGNFTNFNGNLSVNFGDGGLGYFAEPSGSFHGTTTSSEIGNSGANGQPVGIAPNTTIVGVRVSFSDASIGEVAVALNYAASVADVVNNSWAYNSFGFGEPTDPDVSSWYTAVQQAVQKDRAGLGTVLVFAAGNNRTEGADLALEPVTADPRVIAVAATDSTGQVASYSDPGASLLVAAIGDDITLPGPGGTYTTSASGTSFAAPAVSGIASLVLSINPNLGWRDVQEILADSAYVPPQSTSDFTTNGATTWNGGGMHFSNDLGFGVVDANVAVNLARAWNEQSTSANLVIESSEHATLFGVGGDATITSYLAFIQSLRIQHVQVTLTDNNVLAADTRLVLVSPDGTQSVLLNDPGMVGTTDNTDGLDLDGDVITSNAFWGEDATGVWSLQIQNYTGTVVGTINDWSLTIWGDNAATVATPLVYTPEFAGLAAADPNRMVVSTQGSNATTIDLIALPGTTTLNLNGGAGLIDGVAVTVDAGLQNANADGSTGAVTLTGLAIGGSELTGGDATSILNGAGDDMINAGLGATTINTERGGSTVTLSSLGASQVTITSGGDDTIYAGLATAMISDVGSEGDTIYAEGAKLAFINGSTASTVYTGNGYVLIQGDGGDGAFDISSTGSEQDTITLGGAADLIAIQAGGTGGLDVIQGFRIGTDHLDLLGYASNAATMALQTQTSDGTSGTLLSLSDGTRLDIAGISHLTQSAFT
jgi:subtilisin family serine protease